MKTLTECWFAHEKLEAYRDAVAFIGWLSAHADVVASVDEVKDLMNRAAIAAAMSIAEGSGKSAPEERSRLLDAGLGAALQCAVGLDVLVARLAMTPEEVRPGKELLQRVVQTLIGLLKHPAETVPDAPANEDAVDDALSELLADGDGESADEEEDSAPPAKTRPPESEKPTPAKSKTVLNGDEQDQPRISTRYWITLAVLAVVAAAYWLLQGSASASLDTLASRALTASSPEARQNAAVDLAARGQQDAGQAAPLLKRVASESTDPEVIVQAINGLSTLHESSSMSIMRAHLDHADARVRSAAFAVLLKFYGGTLPDDLTYSPDDPAEKRAQVAARLKELSEQTPRYLQKKK